MLLFAALSVSAQTKDGQIVKTGLNFGPLPAVAFDADKGFQLGAILNIYDFGNGSNYPNYDSKWYFEASFFTKGSQLYTVQYDNKTLIPGVRWSSSISANIDKAMDFFGFNGYMSYYNYDAIAQGKDKSSAAFDFSPYYKIARTSVLASTDFTGAITDHLSWEAGYHGSYFKVGSIDRASINKGKSDVKAYPAAQTTLYDRYVNSGIILPEEADGGFISALRLGLVYDTRDKEGAPSSGIWAEGHITAAPKWLGTTNPHYRYSLTFRNYLPVVKNNVLTFAYRLNYEGTIGNYAPYYALPYITVMGENCDKDGMGGYRTVRGMLRDRVVGLDMFTYTAELRWRFVNFRLWNQNIAFGLSAFSDGSIVTRAIRPSKVSRIPGGQQQDYLHATIGSGLRFIMNENFIVAFEYGTPFTHFMKNSPLYNQDGTGAFYINIGYLF